MKSLLLLLTTLFVFVGFSAGAINVPMPSPVSDDALLDAIAAVETGNNPRKLGHDGERSQLQILPATWREYSRLPHSVAASNRAETERVARAYLATIRSRLKARGLPDTPFFIAASWNAGPGWRRLKPRTVAYAERVTNLVEEAQSVSANVPAPQSPKMAAKPVPIIPISGVLNRGVRLASLNVPGLDRMISN